ncbi:uncharacterized protein PAC_14399 [Phialocephala subalpina]|uniref:Uncharacterized protein n=1 Tax=Phialocephala subalpina TaxID=576137 RepID=A0A1L7XHJ7_9HELO|nr:uncharacterized protein PAC_14399 [Phialocephala subalpina]
MSANAPYDEDDDVDMDRESEPESALSSDEEEDDDDNANVDPAAAASTLSSSLPIAGTYTQGLVFNNQSGVKVSPTDSDPYYDDGKQRADENEATYWQRIDRASLAMGIERKAEWPKAAKHWNENKDEWHNRSSRDHHAHGRAEKVHAEKINPAHKNYDAAYTAQWRREKQERRQRNDARRAAALANRRAYDQLQGRPQTATPEDPEDSGDEQYPPYPRRFKLPTILSVPPDYPRLNPVPTPGNFPEGEQTNPPSDRCKNCIVTKKSACDLNIRGWYPCSQCEKMNVICVNEKGRVGQGFQGNKKRNNNNTSNNNNGGNDDDDDDDDDDNDPPGGFKSIRGVRQTKKTTSARTAPYSRPPTREQPARKQPPRAAASSAPRLVLRPGSSAAATAPSSGPVASSSEFPDLTIRELTYTPTGGNFPVGIRTNPPSNRCKRCEIMKKGDQCDIKDNGYPCSKCVSAGLAHQCVNGKGYRYGPRDSATTKKQNRETAALNNAASSIQAAVASSSTATQRERRVAPRPSGAAGGPQRIPTRRAIAQEAARGRRQARGNANIERSDWSRDPDDRRGQRCQRCRALDLWCHGGTPCRPCTEVGRGGDCDAGANNHNHVYFAQYPQRRSAPLARPDDIYTTAGGMYQPPRRNSPPTQRPAGFDNPYDANPPARPARPHPEHFGVNGPNGNRPGSMVPGQLPDQPHGEFGSYLQDNMQQRDQGDDDLQNMFQPPAINPRAAVPSSHGDYNDQIFGRPQRQVTEEEHRARLLTIIGESELYGRFPAWPLADPVVPPRASNEEYFNDAMAAREQADLFDSGFPDFSDLDPVYPGDFQAPQDSPPRTFPPPPAQPPSPNNGQPPPGNNTIAQAVLIPDEPFPASALFSWNGTGGIGGPFTNPFNQQLHWKESWTLADARSFQGGQRCNEKVGKCALGYPNFGPDDAPICQKGYSKQCDWLEHQGPYFHCGDCHAKQNNFFREFDSKVKRDMQAWVCGPCALGIASTKLAKQGRCKCYMTFRQSWLCHRHAFESLDNFEEILLQTSIHLTQRIGHLARNTGEKPCVSCLVNVADGRSRVWGCKICREWVEQVGNDNGY